MSVDNKKNHDPTTQHTLNGCNSRSGGNQMRAYRVGFSSKDIPGVFAYIRSLQKKSLKRLQDPIVVDTAIQVVQSYTGKYGSSILKEKYGSSIIRDAIKALGIPNAASNLHESTYRLLLANVKTYLDMLRKVDVMLGIITNDARLRLEWALLGRSPYLESQLSQQLGVKFEYARNIVQSTSKRFAYSAQLPKIGKNDLLVAADALRKDLQQKLLVSSSKNLQIFANRVQYCIDHIDELHQVLVSWDGTWKNLKKLSIRFRYRSFLSAVRSILVRALLARGVNPSIGNTSAEDLVSKPFSNPSATPPPVSLLMGSRFVVLRSGNRHALQQEMLRNRVQRSDNGFSSHIDLLFPVRRGQQIAGRVHLAEKLVQMIDAGAEIRSLTVSTSNASSKKVTFTIILEFVPVSTTLSIKYSKALNVPKEQVIGIDINRLGPYVLSFSNGVTIPREIIKDCNKYVRLGDNLAELQSRQSRVRNRTKKFKLGTEIKHVHNKRVNILKSIHDRLSHFTAANLIASQAEYLAVENLNISARGTRGALAKAILSMPDNQQLYARACGIASEVLGREVQIKLVDPRNTSKIHFGCGGTLLRSGASWDYAKCKACGKQVNTHRNASHNICGRAIVKIAK